MDALNSVTGNDYESPNQAASHIESESLGSEWIDEDDDDDMDFEPTADSTDQDADFLDPSEDAEAEFQGMVFLSWLVNISDLDKAVTNLGATSYRCRGWTDWRGD